MRGRRHLCRPEAWTGFSANLLILLDHEKWLGRFIHAAKTSCIILAISLAGTRVMNRMSVEGTVPVRSHNGGAAG
jgi:hypothetical protein